MVDIYLNYKKEYQQKYGKQCIVMIESGHFMEVYGYQEDDDQFNICRDILNIMVTRRDKEPDKSLYNQFMAGIPTHSIKRYYKMLVKNNYTVVIVEQVTPPPMVERKVTKILSPGCSLSEDIYHNAEVGISILVSILLEIDDDNEYYIELATFDTNLGISSLETIVGNNNQDKLTQLKNNLELIQFNEIIITVLNYNVELNQDKIGKELNDDLYLKDKMLHLKYYTDKKEDELFNNFYKLSYQTTFLEKIFSHYHTIYNSIQETLGLIKQNPSLIVNYIILLNFVSLHDNTLIQNISKPDILQQSQLNYLTTFNDTYTKLNIFDYQGNTKYSLFSLINFTSCKSSERILLDRLKKPSLDIDEINFRYDLIEELLTDVENITNIEKYLKIHDLQRIYRRFSIGKLNPYEIPRVYYSNCQIINLIDYLSTNKDNLNLIYKHILPNKDIIDKFNQYNQEINSIFNHEICAKSNLQNIQDSLFNDGIFIEIDKLKDNINNLKNKLKSIAYQLSTFIYAYDEKKELKDIIQYNLKDKEKEKIENYVTIRYNDKEGFWLDLSQTRGDKLKQFLKKYQNPEIKCYLDNEKNNNPNNNINNNNNNEFIFYSKQIEWNTKNKTNCKIFSQQIKYISQQISQYQERLILLSKEKYIYEIQRLYNKYFIDTIQPIIKFVIDIDIIKSNAKSAYLYKYTRPIIEETDINQSSSIEIKEVRHPIIEQIIKENGYKYIPNSIEINKDNGYLIYGVNSVGKSSFLKSIAISIIMAQAGLFVPASYMKFSLYHKIFSRMGNDDNLFLNHSSFVKEMMETKEIIKKSDNKSLIIADELCASTEIDSAVKIVSSILQILSNKKSSFIFATHIFQLSEINLVKNLNTIRFKHLKVKFEDELIFERTLTDGLPENRQYGCIVADKIIQDDDFNSILNNQSNFETDRQEQQTIINSTFSKYNHKLILDKCQVCQYIPTKKTDIPLETHHINMQCNTDNNGYHGIYHKNELHNLVSLCRECHQQVHKDKIIIEGYQQTDKGNKLIYYNLNNDIINNNVTTDNNNVTTDNNIITTDNNNVITDNNNVITDNNNVITDNNVIDTDDIFEKFKYQNINQNIQEKFNFESKKKKKKYNQDTIDFIKQYQIDNKHKTKTMILNELKKYKNTESLSMKSYSQIINNQY